MRDMLFRLICLITVLASLSWLVGSRSAAGQEPPRPNIVFFYADDLGYGDVGCYGSPHAGTPHLDGLAEEGTRFTQFYVSHCVCSPTRCSAITGHFPSRHRIFAHIAWLEGNRRRGMPDWLDVDAPSMPRALQRAGYRTAIIGKWHLGGGSGSMWQSDKVVINHPDAPAVARYGFDHVRTTFGNSPTWKNGELHASPHDVYPYADPGWQRWSSRAIADETIAFLEDHVDQQRAGGAADVGQPFYVNVWLKDVHTPFRPTDEMLKPYLHLSEPQRTHYAMVHFMDQQIGRVLERLDELGLRDNTLVLFSSDNGAVKGRGGSNGQLRDFKWSLYEGGIRVPLIARWPSVVPAGTTDKESVLNIVDIVPTFCQWAGAEMPPGYEADGVDITSAVKGQPLRRSKPMFWHHPTAPKGTPVLAVRDANWKLLVGPRGTAKELYDLAADPGETKNLAAEQPQVVIRLEQMLMQWYASLPRQRSPRR